MSETSAPVADPFTEFTNILDALLSVKPPGVSGSKIRSLTSLAVSNVKLEKSMIDALYNHLIKTPYSHKLGILYVVDAIARGYQDLAVNETYSTQSEAPEGTYTAAVYRISQLVENMFVNIFGIPPAEDIKDKMKKVIDIWERCETFPQETLDTIKRKWFNDNSTTPPSSPPSHIVEAVRKLTEEHKAQKQDEEPNQELLSPSLRAQETSATSEAPSEISSEAPAVASAPVSDAAFIAKFLEKIKQDSKPTTEDDGTSSSSDNTLDSKTEGGEPSANILVSDDSNSASSTATAALQSDLITQLLKQNQQGSTTVADASSAPSTNAEQSWNEQTEQNEHQEEDSGSDDKRGFDRRRRSRSPDGRGNSKRARNNSPKRGKQLDIKPDHEITRERNVTRDPTIPDGSIKVLSRTLFIGGVTSDTTEESLVQIFKPFAEVQSMVFHKEMRHAFVKLYSRAEAEISRERLEEENKSGRLGLRARWGVGFGPRECCDYQTGISIIPLSKLTEADRRWIVEAEFGGTGGAPLDTGLCIEEPDIEIGAGVSSKAISQRMPSNSSRNGPKSSRGERLDRPEPTFNGGAPSGSNSGSSGGSSHGRRRDGGRHDRRSGRDRDRGRNGGGSGSGNRNGGRYGNGDRNGGGGGGFRDQRGGGRQSNNGGGNFNGGMPNFGGPVGMPNMGMPGMNMPGAGGFNLPANLATLISSLNPQGMAPGGAPMQQPPQNNHNQRYDRGRGGNRHNNNNNNGGNNNNGNNNNPQQLLAQLTQQLSAAAAAQQFGMGGGAPMGGPPPYGGAPPQSYGAPGVSSNLSAALFQLQQAGNQGGRNGNGAPPPPGLGGSPMGGPMGAPMGNGGQLPFNMTQQMATALLQQHHQQQQHHHHQNQRRN